jgi:TonB family protein
MMPALSSDNLLSWAVQVLTIASAGALLPLVFRIRHPRSHLVYCHLVLIACLTLPILQPWHQPIIEVPAPSAISTSPLAASPVASQADQAAASLPWDRILVGIFLAGVAVRLAWLAAGFFQIYRYRATALPMYPLPESIKSALAVTKADARFYLSSGVPGPVTFGIFPPVVLLPESFRTLGRDEQYGIACHELLHVRRRDWLSTITEEIISVLFWFNPAIWWLLAQTRLTREQLVDSEVVRLTSAPEPYIEALLAMAGTGARLDLAPAPLFLRRRHLAQRMHSLLSEVSMSAFRLASSYITMVAILFGAGWLVLGAFPLTGEAQQQFQFTEPVRVISQNEGGVTTINAGGNVMRRANVGYPPEALTKRIEGTVFAELTVAKTGEVTDARIMSGPTELRRGVLQSVLQWRYAPDSVPTGTVVVSVDFRVQPVSNAAVPETATVRGGVRGGVVPPPPPPPPPAPTGVVASIDATNVVERFRAQVTQGLQRFVGQQASSVIPQLNQAVNEALPPEAGGRIWGFRRADNGVDTVITISTNLCDRMPCLNGTVVRTPFGEVVPGQRGGRGGAPQTAETPFGTVGGVVGGPATAGVQRMRVGGNVAAANLRQQVKPEYPALAKQARIQGVVVLEAVISDAGQVTSLSVVTGHPLLIQAAMEAVQQWIYEPIKLNGQPMEVVTTVTVNFAMQEQ